MATSQSSDWAKLRQQARAQETQTETLFHTYAQLASQTTIPPSPSPDELKTETRLSDLLSQRSTLIAHLARLLDSEPSPPSALKSTNLARHREILHQHRAELTRLKAQLQQARDRANLLTTVRSDIDAHRAATAGRLNDSDAPEAEYMLSERRRVENSHSMMDSVLSQAYATNENFGVQRETLASIQRRITGAAAQVPGINGLMQRIGSKKRRDGIILGTFIAVCCLILLWFW